MTTTIDGREWTFTRNEIQPSQASAADLASRGWVPAYFSGVSLPVGKQRKTFHAFAYQCAKSGQFVIVHKA
jgi:hypothetical protein